MEEKIMSRNYVFTPVGNGYIAAYVNKDNKVIQYEITASQYYIWQEMEQKYRDHISSIETYNQPKIKEN